MPSPIAHSLCGCACFALFRTKNKISNWKELAACVVIANLADLDYLPGIFNGQPNKFHRQFTHGVIFAVIVALVFSSLQKKRDFLKNIIVSLSLGFSHLVIDYFGGDTAPPYGIPLFYPFGNKYFISPIQFFMDLDKANSSTGFFQSLLSIHNLWAILVEILILAPIIFLIHFIKKSQS